MNLQEKMFSLISDWKSSGELKSKFLKDTGISTAKFDYWLKKYKELASTSDPVSVSPDFISLEEILGKDSSCGLPVLELSTASGITIKIFE